jgi:hypothetical protein
MKPLRLEDLLNLFVSLPFRIRFMNSQRAIADQAYESGKRRGLNVLELPGLPVCRPETDRPDYALPLG